MDKTKKRVSLLAVLVCLVVLIFSLALAACNVKPNVDPNEQIEATWYYGSAFPNDRLGKVGDYYLNTDNLSSYVKEQSGWRAISMEEAGNWYYGTEKPVDSMGSKNDFYLNTVTGELYQKGGSAWGDPILTLKGNPGRDGVIWFSGNKLPKDAGEILRDAQTGDFYLNYGDFTVWQKDAEGEWQNLGSLKGHDGVTPELPEAEKVTVTYDVNGGDALDVSSIEIEKGECIPALPVPTHKNYVFLGWFTGDGVNDGQVTTVTAISRDITLYAHWEFNGKYTFDTFAVDGKMVSQKNGIGFHIDTVHEFEFTAHGKDDSVFQIWYAKEGVAGQAVWGRPLGGTVYTKGFRGEVVRGEEGEMSIAIGNVTFAEAGKYSLYMEADGNMSDAWTVEVKDKLVITPAAPGEEKLELIEGKIESPETKIEMEFGETKELTFVLQHSALKADSKPRIILGANGKRSAASWMETSDDYEVDSGFDMYVDESFYYCTLDEYFARKGQTPYGEFSFPRNGYPERRGNYPQSVETGVGLPYGEFRDSVQTGPDKNEKKNTICAYYNGVEYWYDETQQKFVTRTWPQEVLPVEDGKDFHVKPYLYTYTYGEERQPRGFTGLYMEEGSSTTLYDRYDSAHFAGIMRVSKFEVHEGYAEITLEMSANPDVQKSTTAITYNPTLIYELDVDGTPVRFDLIKGEKITQEEGYEKAKLNVEIKKSIAPVSPVQPEAGSTFERLNVAYLNEIASDDYNLTWTGESDDFKFLGLYVNNVPVAENEFYRCDDFELAYRYNGVTDPGEKKRVTFDFYYLMVFKSFREYPIRIEYSFKGKIYSQTVQIWASGPDSSIAKMRGYAMLDTWEKFLEQHRDDPDEKGYLARIREIITPLVENKELLSPKDLAEVFAVYGNGASKVEEMNIAAIVAKNDSSFETKTVEHFNAVAAKTVNKLLDKYPGANRAILYAWYEANVFKPIEAQIVGSYWQPKTANEMYQNFFYGAYTKNTSGMKGYDVLEYISTHDFGCVEIMASYIEYMFENYAPETTQELIDNVYLSYANVKETHYVFNSSFEKFAEAFKAYHAAPDAEGALEAYIKAANECATAKNLLATHMVNGGDSQAYAMRLLNWSYTQAETEYNEHMHSSDPALKALWDAYTEARTAANSISVSEENLADYTEKVEAYAAAMGEYCIAADNAEH